MALSLQQWESDPLFSAAEVVQDSTDRMESIFRLLLHEQSLVQGDHPEPKLLNSVEYHRRDLVTTIETAKWQLEDFEREVNLSAMTDKSQLRQDVILRHKQFIRAIREHIVNVEKSVEGILAGDLGRNSEWVNLNEQDRYGLALFLSGGKPVDHGPLSDSEDSNILRRFLDPTASSSLNDEIVEQDIRETTSLNMNGFVHLDHKFDKKDNKLRRVGSLYSTQMALEAPSLIQGAASDRCDEEGNWDLEANEAKCRSFFQKNKFRGYYSKVNVFGSLGNLLSAYGNRASRSFTKRWKDGEEQRHPPLHTDVSQAAQSFLTRLGLASRYINPQQWSDLLARVMHSHTWLEQCWARYQRSHTQVSCRPVRLISAILLTLIFLGILASLVA
ncbi:unnamed protein product [Ilex paraguariensis]|uniref:Syntaxin 6/10/61 N-terminal domain-containing protein n=1 Tax=Ilex paraguariensis TaxID=185542 RepID=A0ABC8S457_9AQUA